MTWHGGGDIWHATLSGASIAVYRVAYRRQLLWTGHALVDGERLMIPGGYYQNVDRAQLAGERLVQRVKKKRR